MTENKRIVEAYMDGFRNADRSQILSCPNDDVEWKIPGAFHVRGKQAFAEHIVDEPLAFGDGRSCRAIHPFDQSELHEQPRHHLGDMVMQLPRQGGAAAAPRPGSSSP